MAHILFTDNGPAHRKLFVDGADITQGVRSIEVSCDATGLTRVVLELNTFDCTLNGEATVVIPEGTQDALIALGWTPPDP